MPEAPKRERPSFDIGRSEIKVNMTGTNPQMKFPLIIKGKFMYLVVSHNKRTKFTKVQLGGKYNTTVKGKKLNDDGIWPLSLICADLKVKI